MSDSQNNSTQFLTTSSRENNSSSTNFSINFSRYPQKISFQNQENILNQEQIEAIIKEQLKEYFKEITNYNNALEKSNEKKITTQTKNMKTQLIKTIEEQLAQQSQEIRRALIQSTTTQINTQVTIKTKDLDKIVLKAENEIKDARNSVFTTIALFAAFFTFISVNVNIFSKATSIEETLTITLLMWSCILGFLILFFYFLNEKIKKAYFNFMWLISFIIVAIFIFHGYSLNKKNEALALQYISKNQTPFPLKSALLEKIINTP